MLSWTVLFFHPLTGLQLTDSGLDPPADQLSANPALDNPTRYNINTGVGFTISCTFTHSSDSFTVSFYKDGMVISDGDLKDTELTVPTAGTEQTIELTFNNFQPAHDGVYRCSASTTDTNEELSSDLYLYGSGEDCPPVWGEQAHHNVVTALCFDRYVNCAMYKDVCFIYYLTVHAGSLYCHTFNTRVYSKSASTKSHEGLVPTKFLPLTVVVCKPISYCIICFHMDEQYWTHIEWTAPGPQ